MPGPYMDMQRKQKKRKGSDEKGGDKQKTQDS